MRIGVDASTWNNRRGFGRFTRELLEAMLAIDNENEYLFFVDSKYDDLVDIPSNVRIVAADTKVSPIEAASATGRRSLQDIWAMSRAVWRHKIDLFFFPAVYSYFPVINRTKIVVTIHDVIADHYPDLVFPNSKLKMFWKSKQNLAIWQSDKILTVSEYSKKEILNYFNLNASKVAVITEGAKKVFQVIAPDEESRKVLARYKLQPPDKFLLYVGGISPHKNLVTLVNAFKIIVTDPNKSEIKLILVGDYKDDPFFSVYPALKKLIAELELSDKVIFTGFIEDSELAYLYNSATMVVLPSFEEGFGLPAVESMACGTPVVASNRGSLPEVLGMAGRFFDPLDKHEMVKCINQVLDNELLQNEMSIQGLIQSQNFLWKKAAQDLLKIFAELVDK